MTLNSFKPEDEVCPSQVRITESTLNGFDPETKKTWKATTRTQTIQVLLGLTGPGGNLKWVIGERTRTEFSQGTVHGWEWTVQTDPWKDWEITKAEILPWK